MTKLKVWSGRAYCGYLLEPRINGAGDIIGVCAFIKARCSKPSMLECKTYQEEFKK